MTRLTWSAAAALLFLTLPGRAADQQAGGIAVDRQKRTVTIDARVAPRKLEHLKGEIYPIEVIACWPHPKGKKAHETVVTVEARPSEVHRALEGLGLKAGKPVMGEGKQAGQGPALWVYLEMPDGAGGTRRLPVEKTLVDRKTGKPMPKLEWRFTGSVLSRPAPDRDEKVYGADLTGTLIAVFPVTDQTVVQTNLRFDDQKYLRLETDAKVLPAEGTPVKLVLEVPAGK